VANSTVAFYISGHGFGHASRQIEIAKAFGRRRPDVGVLLRTTAPRWLFDRTMTAPFILNDRPCDTGAIQIDSLNVDAAATIARAKDFYETLETRAAAEAVLMAKRLTKRERVLVSADVHPHYRQTIDTYLQGIGEGKASIVTVPIGNDGCPNLGALAELLDESISAVVVGYPNFYGCVTDVRRIAELAHQRGALVITATQEPFALALLESPGALGADIAIAEGQPLGIPPQFGGPYVGLFACREGRDFLQQIPGRLCGETVDKNGERGYVLTLSTREQHIRRERATSNICTNTGLCALAVTIRMSMLGKQGFLQVGEQCLSRAEYLKGRIAALAGYALVFPKSPTFNEFAVRVRGGSAARVVDALEPKGMLAGLDLGRMDPTRADQLLIAVTERASRTDLDAFVAALDAL